MGFGYPRYSNSLVIVLILATLSGCGDAPHDNPLDPDAGLFNPILGHIRGFYEPHRPLEGIIVKAPQFGISDTTNATGAFELLYVPPESCLITISDQGFQASSLWVAEDAEFRRDVTIYLNALPRITNATLTSTYEATWYPSPFEEWIIVSATVVDADGIADIDSVVCELPNDMNIRLTEGEQLGRWSATVSGEELGTLGVETIVGFDAVVKAWDFQGASSGGSTVRLARVVRDVASLVDPVGLEEVGSKPIFQWIPGSPLFYASQRIIVIRDDNGVETEAWSSQFLSITTDSLQIGTNLSIGSYYWAVYTIDGFGNRGRSREAAFLVDIDN